MICPNCGGDYADWAVKCPYCGSVNEKADEQAYLAHLEDVRKRLDTVDEESETVYKKSIGRMSVKVLKFAGIAVIVIALLFTLAVFIGRNSDDKYEEIQVAQQKWEKTEFPILNEMYEKGDYDGILAEEERVYTSSDESDFSLMDWEHYYFCLEFYPQYAALAEVEAQIAGGETLDYYYVGNAIYATLFFETEATDSRISQLEKSLNTNGNGLTEEEAALVVSYREEAGHWLQDHLGLTDEQVSDLEESCIDDGYVSLSACYKEAKKLVKNM